jgi:hypothetical protein
MTATRPNTAACAEPPSAVALVRSAMTDKRYSRQDVDAILGRALEREHGRDELTHDELVEAAREVGVTPEAIERAAAEVMAERREREELSAARAREWREFFAHLIPFFLVNALLITINVFTSRFPWALFPLFGWGVGLASHLYAVAVPDPERLARRRAHEAERERRRKVKRQLKAGAKEFEHAVEQGVAALLHVAAERISERAEASRPAGTQRVRVGSAGPSASEPAAEAFGESTPDARQKARS